MHFRKDIHLLSFMPYAKSIKLIATSCLTHFYKRVCLPSLIPVTTAIQWKCAFAIIYNFHSSVLLSVYSG